MPEGFAVQRNTGKYVHTYIDCCGAALCCKLIRVFIFRPECSFLDTNPFSILIFALVAAENCHSVVVSVVHRAGIVIIRSPIIAETGAVDNEIPCTTCSENCRINFFCSFAVDRQNCHVGVSRRGIIVTVCRNRNLSVCGVQLVILSSRYFRRERLPRLIVSIKNINTIAVRSIGLAVHLDQLILAVAAVRPFAAGPRLILRYDNAVLQRDDRAEIGSIAGCFRAILVEIIDLAI